ncbi:MAG: hypothetical protein WC953_03915 [Pseudomonas sp.]
MPIIKNVIAPICLLLSTSVVAQNGTNMDQMMQGMAQMAICLQNLDQDRLAAIGEEAQRLEKDLQQLCANGERDKAQDKAVAFAMKVTDSKDIQQLRQCGEMALKVMPDIPDYSAYADPDSGENRNHHVCDNL